MFEEVCGLAELFRINNAGVVPVAIKGSAAIDRIRLPIDNERHYVTSTGGRFERALDLVVAAGWTAGNSIHIYRDALVREVRNRRHFKRRCREWLGGYRCGDARLAIVEVYSRRRARTTRRSRQPARLHGGLWHSQLSYYPPVHTIKPQRSEVSQLARRTPRLVATSQMRERCRYSTWNEDRRQSRVDDQKRCEHGRVKDILHASMGSGHRKGRSKTRRRGSTKSICEAISLGSARITRSISGSDSAFSKENYRFNETPRRPSTHGFSLHKQVSMRDKLLDVVRQRDVEGSAGFSAANCGCFPMIAVTATRTSITFGATSRAWRLA
jgi:hypothetical protein